MRQKTFVKKQARHSLTTHCAANHFVISHANASFTRLSSFFTSPMQ
ncbi:hypothetical protein [uncultured Helicobacter sp.]